MTDFADAFQHAFALIVTADQDLFEIVGLSMQVTLTAVLVACLIGFPLGAWVAVTRSPLRGVIGLLLNTAMSLPPVVVGLGLYLLFSRAGPLGVLELLYTPAAMIIAQVILVAPLVAAITRSAVEALFEEHGETLRAMRASTYHVVETLLIEARPGLITAALAGCGRGLAEVGAVMIVGGNINHLTRVMTTTIAQETSRDELALALALGMILIMIALLLNMLIAMANRPALPRGPRHA